MNEIHPYYQHNTLIIAFYFLRNTEPKNAWIPFERKELYVTRSKININHDHMNRKQD